MKSKYLAINVTDLIKGAFVAAGTVMLSLVGSMVEAGVSVSDAQIMSSVKVGIFAAVSYLIKNLFTNSDDKLFKSE